MAHDAAPAVAPVIAPTSSSMDVFLASRAATRFPIRSTWIRSATSITCGIEWLMKTTATPLSATRRIVSSTLRV